MRVLGIGIHEKFGKLGAAQFVLWQHALYGNLYQCLWVAGVQCLGAHAALATWVTGVVDVLLILHLVAGEHYLVGIDDDYVVASVDIRGKARLVLAAQDSSYLGSQTAQYHVLGINNKPLTLHRLVRGRLGFVT